METKLSDFIRDNTASILEGWDAFAKRIILPSDFDVRDHAVGMLNAIVADMEKSQTPKQQIDKGNGLAREDATDNDAELHGAMRQAAGFNMSEAVSEFRSLRATVIRLWVGSCANGLQSDLDGLVRFNEAIDKVLAESIARYAADQRREASKLEKDLRREKAISDTIIESTPAGFFMIDEQTNLIRWNRYLNEETGMTDEELAGTSVMSIFHEQDRPLAAATFLTAFATGFSQMEVRVQTVGFGIRLYLKTARRFEIDGVFFVASFGIDVTERREAEHALVKEKAFFDAMVESTPGAFYVIDMKGNYCRWNSYLRRLTGLSDKDLLHRASLLVIQEEDRPQAAAIMKEAFENGYAQGEVHVVTSDRGTRHFFMSSRRFEVENAKFLVGIGLDTTDRRARMEQLEHEAQTDSLTQVANRARFIEIANQELARCRRYGHALSIWMIDIDHFKKVNDMFGHHVGDIALQSLMTTSRRALRDWDIVGRMGGEEFAVLLPETDAHQALEVAERLRIAVASTEISIDGGNVVHLTVSTGVATAGENDVAVDSLLERADKALYKAKHTGRNKVCMASEATA